MNRFILLVVLLLSLTSIAQAQEAKNSELFLTLKKQDSIFFERAFNNCDIAYLDKVIHKDLVFYHDISGLQNRAIFFENTKKYICGDLKKKVIRKPEEGTFEVYPLHNNGVLYGAIQTGTHNFFIREAGKEDVQTGLAKFTHVYLLENEK